MTMLNETLTRLEDSLRTLASGPKGPYDSQTNQKLFDPYPEKKVFWELRRIPQPG